MKDLLLPGLRTKSGSIAGRYRVERVLGTGSTGYVVLARHLILRQRVALKILPQRADLTPAHAAANLSGTHVARIVDTGFTEEGMPFIASEYVEGTSLAELTAQRPLGVEDAVKYVLQACAALAEAHAAGVVHGNLKPQNLMVTADGTVKVLDFGRIRPVEAATFRTPPAYLAPEQITEEGVGPAADVWALGVLLQKLISGGFPFRADTVAGLLVAMANDEPAPLEGVPAELAAVVKRCLAKSPADRPKDVAALAHALAPFADAKTAALAASADRMLGHEPMAATTSVGPAAERAHTMPMPTRPRGRRKTKRHTRTLAGVGPQELAGADVGGAHPTVNASAAKTAMDASAPRTAMDASAPRTAMDEEDVPPASDTAPDFVSPVGARPFRPGLATKVSSDRAASKRRTLAMLGAACVVAAVSLVLPNEDAPRSTRALLDPPPPLEPTERRFDVRAAVPASDATAQREEDAASTENAAPAPAKPTPVPALTESAFRSPPPTRTGRIIREDPYVQGFTHPSRLGGGARIARGN